MEAKRLALHLLDSGATWFSSHARVELTKDGLIEADVVNTIRHGTAHQAMLQPDGTYSYKLTRRDVAVALSFRFDEATPIKLVVQTAWRIRRKP